MITRSQQTVTVYNLTTRNGIFLASDVVTSNCNDSADQGEIDLNDEFDGGDSPPAHPGCLCSIAPVVYEDAGDEDTEKAAAARDLRKLQRDVSEIT